MLIKKNLEDFSMQKANETNTVYFSHFYLAKQKKNVIHFDNSFGI